MKTFRLRLTPRSGFLTPVQADTLFGHLAWAYRHRNGVAKLGEFLERFSTDPPFVLSDAFPANFLPTPRLAPDPADAASLSQKWEAQVPGLDGRAVLGQVAKRVKKAGFIPVDILSECVNVLSWRAVMERMIDILPGIRRADPAKPGRYFEIEGFDGLVRIRSAESVKAVLTMKNVIDRRSHTVGPGGLFSIKETYFPHELDVWVGLRGMSTEEFMELMSDVRAIGYGRRKSAGQGQFDIAHFEETALPVAEDPTHFLSLSGFLPAADDPMKGSYSIRVKRGRIGENWAEFGSFLKKPLFMLEPGAIFAVAPPRRDYFGSLVHNVHARPEIRHYGFALPLYVRLVS